MSSDNNDIRIDVHDAEDLWRRIALSQIFYDPNLKRKRPNTGVFKDKALSVYIASIVLDFGRTSEDILVGKYEFHSMASFTAGFARGLG